MKNITMQNTELIFGQLSKVCSSNELKPKYKLCELLNYLVKETLSGRSEQIKNYSIGLDIFKRSEDFNPELDPIVRIEVGRLRNSLNKYYLTDGKNDSIRIFIPRRSYVPEFITQEEVRPYSPGRAEDTEQVNSDSSLQPSVLVLPFANLTGDENQEYFVQGFTEELSIELSRFEYFRILGFRGSSDIHNHDYDEILKKLHPRFLIEGSVRKKTNELKISVKLIDTNSNEQLWCEQFKRKLSSENLINIQEDIARETVIIIANEFGIIPKRIRYDSRYKKPAELESYEAMLRYYYYQTQHTPGVASQTLAALEQAAIKEPDNGVILAMIATIYGNRYMLDLGDEKNSLEKMVELSGKAMQLEPNQQLVRIAYAWSYFVLEKKDKFLLETDNALALKPKSPFRIGAIGFFLSLYGEWERGKSLLDEAISQSVGFPGWYYGATVLYYYRLNEFEKAYNEALKYNVTGLFWGPMLRAATLGQLGRKSDAEKEMSDLHILKPEFESKAYHLISRYVKEETIVDLIMDGLQKAGMKIEVENSINK